MWRIMWGGFGETYDVFDITYSEIRFVLIEALRG